MARIPMALPSGSIVGSCEILSPLGAGGMGEVYRARDILLNREVAVKVLRQLSTTDSELLRRFELEARAAAALNHPNILVVHQLGTADGAPYLVTELLEGETLHEMLKRGPLPVRKAIDIGVQIAHGLAAAHERGIVHRDLKPENLFVTKDGRVKILDFGLAKLGTPMEGSSGVALTLPLHTEPGVLLGTVGYMAPEQVRGQSADHRADIFSLGAILYEMVTGSRTFQKQTSADTMSASLNEDPTALSQLAPSAPLALERVVHRCLEKNPERRFQSASDLAFALEALSDPALSSVGIRAGSSASRRFWWGVGTALIVLALVAGFYWYRSATRLKVSGYEQLTHDGDRKTLVGADGSRLFLALGSSVGSSSQGIAELSVSGGELRKLSGVPSPDMFPVDVSRDGSQLLVIDGQGAPPRGPLWSLPTLGGSPRRFGDIVAETAAWSADGRLAYANRQDLYLANADGGEPQRILTATGEIKNIVWSPDGAHLRLDISEAAGGFGRGSIWETSLDGKDLHRLFPGWHTPPDECCGEWTPNGAYFVFQSKGQIWALSHKGLLPTAAKPIQLTSSPMSLSTPIPSRDGRKLFVVGQTYRGELMRYDTNVGQFVPYLGGVSGEFANVSKDGQWVAYVSYPQGNLWRSRIDGSDRMQLTYPPLYAMLPRWSPNGKKVVFFEFEAATGRPAGMYEISPEGGAPVPLAPRDVRHQKDPNWSPDGGRIVFGGEANDPDSSIRILDVATNQVTAILDSRGLFSPRWSPDGRYLLACSSDSMRLMLYDFSSQEWSELGKGPLGWLNWSSDGKYAYFLDYHGSGSIRRIRISDRQSELVVDLKDFITAGRYDGSMTLAPDDSPVLLRDTGSQDVYALSLE
jgi:eukaryotic-like serine/threonine-protein kinase